MTRTVILQTLKMINYFLNQKPKFLKLKSKIRFGNIINEKVEISEKKILGRTFIF